MNLSYRYAKRIKLLAQLEVLFCPCILIRADNDVNWPKQYLKSTFFHFQYSFLTKPSVLNSKSTKKVNVDILTFFTLKIPYFRLNYDVIIAFFTIKISSFKYLINFTTIDVHNIRFINRD